MDGLAHGDQNTGTAPRRAPVKIDFGIVCDPRRAETARRLQQRLLQQGIDPRLTWDERRDEWDTHARAWAAPIPPGCTHRLILQEDAVPCMDLERGLKRAIAATSDTTIISLYFGFHAAYRGPSPRHKRAKEAAANARRLEASWIAVPGTWWGVAIMLPVEHIAPMLDFCEGRPEVYDTRMGRWIEAAGKGPVMYPWPSLVDHADEPSLAWPNQVAGRRAHQFLGATKSAVRDWDPTGAIVDC